MMSGETRLEIGTRVTKNTIWINIVLALIKLIAGILARSSAMIADAIHSGSDILTSIAVMIGLAMGSKPADENHPYGHARLEAVTAKIVATLLILTAVGLIYSSGRILLRNEAVAPGTLAIYAAILSILVKEWMYWYTLKTANQINSTAMVADAWHHRSDAFSSIGTLIGIVGARLAFPWLDPLSGIIVALLVCKVGVDVYLQSVQELIDSAPAPEIIEAIRQSTLTQDGVIAINDLKARLQGPVIRVDLEICVDPKTSLRDSHALAHQVEAKIMAQVELVEAVMVHVNPCGSDQATCEHTACNSGQK